MPVYDVEPEVFAGRRAFATAQTLLQGVALRRLDEFVDVGWYDTSVHPESGCFAVVRDGGPLTDLVGEILHVTRGDRSVFAYCVGRRAVPTDLALYRRAFRAIAILPMEVVATTVEVVS